MHIPNIIPRTIKVHLLGLIVANIIVRDITAISGADKMRRGYLSRTLQKKSLIKTPIAAFVERNYDSMIPKLSVTGEINVAAASTTEKSNIEKSPKVSAGTLKHCISPL